MLHTSKKAAFTLSLLTTLGIGRALAADGEVVKRGRYLTEEVARCQDCHTPRDEKGDLDRTKWMQGAEMLIQPVGEPPKEWHKTSPSLTPAGRLWQRWGEPALVKYLVTGLTPKGTKAGPPMPTYTLEQKDAEAIVEYLKTLK